MENVVVRTWLHDTHDLKNRPKTDLVIVFWGEEG